MNIKSKQRSLLTALLIGAAGIISAHAQTSSVTFSVDMGTNIINGSFDPGSDTVVVSSSLNGWGQSAPLVQEGISTVYTNTFSDLIDSNGTSCNYKFQIGSGGTYSYESTYSGGNRAVGLPAGGGNVATPTPFYSDDGAPVTNEVTLDRKSTRLNSSDERRSRMPSSA